MIFVPRDHASGSEHGPSVCAKMVVHPGEKHVSYSEPSKDVIFAFIKPEAQFTVIFIPS